MASVFTGRDSAIVVTPVTGVMYGDLVHEGLEVKVVVESLSTLGYFRQVECE
jgi:putative Ca2+/H+ antiporter (TMEM165/GDT1 family)